MLKIENVTVNAPQMMPLTNIRIDFEIGQVYSIVGQQKEGQETLALLLANILQPMHGKVLINNKDRENIMRREYAGRVSVFHPIYEFELERTVLENIRTCMELSRNEMSSNKAFQLSLLQYIYFDEVRANSKVSKLSEQEYFRLRLLKVFITPTPFLCFLTSPKELQRYDSEEIFLTLLDAINKEKHALIFISEDASFLPITTELWGMHQGNLRFIRY